jgi:hypothetical protein
VTSRDLDITNAAKGVSFTQLERQHLKSIRYSPADPRSHTR